MRTPWLLSSTAVLALLAGCNGTMGGPSGPMASGRDRTMSVHSSRSDPNRAAGVAAAECRKMLLHAKLVRVENGREIYECVSEPGDKP